MLGAGDGTRPGGAVPPATGSMHTLPFAELDAVKFEKLCLWLVTAEGHKNAEHYGLGGADDGRDVVAFKEVEGGTELWFFQCKRRARVTLAELKCEIDKITAGASSRLSGTSPRGVVFIVAGPVSARMRDATRSHAAGLGIDIEFWARTELDQRVKRHPHILAEFFQLPGSPEQAPDLDELAKAGLDAGWARMVHGDYAAAVLAFEEAVAFSARSGHVERERKARMQAARALGEQIVYEHPPDHDRSRILKRVDDHLAAVERLGASPATLSLERAMASRLGDDPTRTLQLATESVSLALGQDDRLIRGEALVVLMQAYWQLDRAAEAMAVADHVAEVCEALPREEPLVVVEATWLRTRCKAGEATKEEARSFCDLVWASLADEARDVEGTAPLGARRAALIVGEVAAEFNRAGLLDESLLLCELGYDLAVIDGSPAMRCNVALQTAELAVEKGDRRRVATYLGHATSAVKDSRNRSNDDEDGPGWQTLSANLLYAQGRISSRLAWLASDQRAIQDAFVDASRWLAEAIDFALDNRTAIKGDVDDFCTDVRWWLARAKRELNELDDAAALFKLVRTAPAMAKPRFIEAIGMEAWLMEADSLLWAGHGEEARRAVQELIDDGRAPDEVNDRSRRLLGYLDNVVLPSKLWLASADAEEIGKAAARRGLAEAVASQVAPLVGWWREWNGGEEGPESELMDYWGRGGFARVAAAVRARPHQAIAVDAVSTDDIRRWARILCPLFETVIVKWKGELGSGFVFVPVHESWGGPGSFGGHGYSLLLGSKMREDWYVAASQGTPLPRSVTRLLATEALELVESGRLVVVPAQLVGCTQSSIGWTDHLLLDGLLGGVVNTIQTDASSSTDRGQRVLDLSKHSVPFMADISLRDLARVLDETEEWVGALRSLLLRSLLSDDLRRENWASIAAIENDMKAACRELREGFERVGRSGGWTVADTDGAIAAGSSPDHPQTGDPVTGLLRTLVADRPSLGPWIPYFRLGARGGHLDWSSPTDLPSPRAAAEPGGSWLCPGTAGAGVRSVYAPAPARDSGS